MANLNLYIVDDTKDTRETLATLFIARQYRVQVFDSGESFLAKADVQSCGCVLLDIRMNPGMSGLQVFDELLRLKSPLLVILLSANLTVSIATNYTKKGAFDCLEKGGSELLLIESVKLAMDQAESLSAKVQARKAACKLWQTLTPTQMKVCRIDRREIPNKEIAYELNMNTRTVETHKSNYYKKLGVRNSTELARFMRDHDIE